MEFSSLVCCVATADLDVEPAAREHADALEFRLDMASEPLVALEGYDGALPIVATNRVDWEGGETSDTETRLDALEAAVANPAVEAVDVELAALEGEGAHDAGRVVAAADEAGVAVIVSTHDFERTPARHAMIDRLERACDRGDVGKLAVTAGSRADVLDLLAVTATMDAGGRRVATMAMGEAGRHSRAVAPLYGSRIAYAPVDPADATAPGQYDLATLGGLIDSLRDG
jgi:3-dehydroquinate dehydratase-1